MRIIIDRFVSLRRCRVGQYAALTTFCAFVAACGGAESVELCSPGQTEACDSTCGPGLRSCDDEGWWAACLPTSEPECLPGETGSCEMSEGELPGLWTCTDTCEMSPCEPTCEPGMRIECEGECGPGARRCDDDGRWRPCVEYIAPACRLGEIEMCLEGGLRRCDESCSFGPCEEESACSPGEEAACLTCGIQICLSDGTWSGCEAECVPGEEELCDEDYPGYCGLMKRVCTDLCTWSECTELNESVSGHREGFW